MKNYFIYGFGLSGEAALNLIIKLKDYEKIFIYDDLKEKREKAKICTKNIPNVYVLRVLSCEVLKNVDLVILSPGVSIYNKVVENFKKKKVEVISELEFGSRYFNKNLIAITGTNGKTTCVKMLNNILNCAKKKSVAVGNVGYPISKAILENKKAKFFVCEVSSFQLEAIKTFKPKIACLLNVTDDHLNRHKSFLNYKRTKLKIAKNLRKKDFFVCNYNIKLKNKDNIVYFGRDNIYNGCFCKNGFVFYKKAGKEEKLFEIEDIPLIGEHNLENVLAVVTICKLLKIKNKFILEGIKNFKLDAHRLQLVYSYNGIKFVDDSKATNVDATVRACECFNEKLILLLGGSDKGFKFDKIFISLPKNIKKVVCFGEVGKEILTCAKKYNFDACCFEKMQEATIFACDIAKGGDIVLLSPANASFDEFSSYKERGDKFLSFVSEYLKDKQ